MLLTFETATDKETYDISTQKQNTTEEEKNYSAGIQADIGEKYGWKFKPAAGIHLDSIIDPFATFKLYRKYMFNKWSVNWQETPYWYNSFGWGFDSYLELNKKFSEEDLFRIATFARWREDIDHFELSQVYSMFHTLDKKKALSYYAGVYGISEPSVHTTHYLIGSTYRQNIHKDYLFIELVPQIIYKNTNNFRAEPSIVFRIEMIFKK